MENNNLKLFKNIIIEPKEGDNRDFEEYEKEMSYEFFRSVEGLVDDIEEGRDYRITGCNTDSGELSVLIYGYGNDLDFQEIKDKPLSDRVKMHYHQGFQIIEVKSDERVFNSGETEEVWLNPFIKCVERIWKGSRYREDGTLEKYPNGETKLSYTYDYVWIVVEKDNKIPFKVINDEWQKITKDKYDFYIKWINQDNNL